MNTAAPQADRTLVVMLGGSAYPHHPSFDNLRFKQSAENLRGYFLDPTAFNLPEANLLWLFDSTLNPGQLNDEIETFLRSANERPEDQQPLDVIITFIGHGFFDDDSSYFLATPSFKPDSPDDSYRFKFLQRTVKKQMRLARKFYLLDACYSGRVAREMMSTVAQRVLNEVEVGAREDPPQRGTAALCASSGDDVARAPEAEEFTMFSGAMLSVLRDPRFGGETLTLHQLHGLIDDRIQKSFGETAVRPEIHIPDQKQGDIAELPLFPVRRVEPETASSVLDALHPDTFADEALLHAVVVCHSTTDPERKPPPLLQVVSDAWNNFRDPIIAAANACRAGWGGAPVPEDRDDSGFLLAHLAIDQAFESEAQMQRAVVALCRAEIAVFDLTEWDEGATFLLGVRAVARRGVTITSVGGDKFTIGGELDVPFNLQLLNLASHSDNQESAGAGKQPYEFIGGKIVNGFHELANLPHYLDLPAYDSVRQLGVHSDAYRPVQASERVLLLCPFNPTYTDKNLRRLDRTLPSQLQRHFAKRGGPAAEKPALTRLLDLKTPRLVAQTLYESIRLTDMCLVDWTKMRPNVVFEAGVRMATNPLGAVYVIEQGAHKALSSDRPGSQVRALLHMFEPIEYPLSGVDIRPFEAMVQRFNASVEANNRGETNPIYLAVGTALDQRSQRAALPLVNELMRSANILDPDDQESAGISPVLYHQVNRELAVEAREAAGERRLAAWLFLSRRYSPVEIARETLLLDQFELLSLQVRRWARRAKRTDLIEDVDAWVKAVKDAAAQEGDT